MWKVLTNWITVAAVISALITIGMGVLSMNPPAYTTAYPCFSFAAAILLARIGYWLAFEQSAGRVQLIFFAFIIFGIIGCLWLISMKWVKDREVTYKNANYTLNKQEELIKILGDKNPSAKILALISLLRSKSIEPELFLSCGYSLEEKYGQVILYDLFKEYGLGDYTPISYPIGYVGLPTTDPPIIENNEKYYFIKGWAIDSESNDFTYELWLNDKRQSIEIDKWKRDDIKKLFKSYKNLPEKNGFELKCKIPNNMINKDVKMRVRIVNKQSTRFRDIFNSWVKITETQIKALPPKSE